MMRISIREDFCGVSMEHHRVDLIHQLDHVLRQLDRGPEYLKQHNPESNANDLQKRKEEYRILRETLLETDTKAIGRTPSFTITPLPVLTPTPGAPRIPQNVYVRTPSSISIGS